MTLAHNAAIKAQLETTGIPVFQGVVHDRPERYITFYTNSGLADTDGRFTALVSRRTIRYVVHFVGGSPEQAQWVADRGVDALTNFKPLVPGWRCNRLRHESSQTDLIDREVPGNAVYYNADEFDLPTSLESV